MSRRGRQVCLWPLAGFWGLAVPLMPGVFQMCIELSFPYFFFFFGGGNGNSQTHTSIDHSNSTRCGNLFSSFCNPLLLFFSVFFLFPFFPLPILKCSAIQSSAIIHIIKYKLFANKAMYDQTGRDENKDGGYLAQVSAVVVVTYVISVHWLFWRQLKYIVH